MPDDEDWVARFTADGLIRREGDALRTTHRWQTAIARAVVRLVRESGDGDDIRIPIAAALLDLYGNRFDDDQLAAAVAAMVPIETAELTGIK
jgi:hypothetical protein